MQPRVLSETIEYGLLYGAKLWHVALPDGGESGDYRSYADAVERARKEWPDLEDDLK